MSLRVIHGDCLDAMRQLAAEGVLVDSIVTDPPAGISFMGRAWDGDKGGRAQWVAWMAEVAAAALALAKPGAHALVWALPRTSHWTATAWEDAGWEVRDRVSHLFGVGFPKSLDVSKAMDKAAGAERDVIGRYDSDMGGLGGQRLGRSGGDITVPATDAARQWSGWGTSLKPAQEDWHWFEKPLNRVDFRSILAEVTIRMELLLWLTAPAKLAEAFLASSQRDFSEGQFGFVRWIAAEYPMRKSGASSELMAMFNSPEMAATYLSTAWSWQACLAALSNGMSTSTTETATSQTTALKILSCLISQSMPSTIIQAWTSASTQGWFASDAGASSPVTPRWLLSIREHTAPETATISTMRAALSALVAVAESSSGPLRVESGPIVPVIVTSAEGLRPNVEDWWLLRKPLSESNIAANVLAHGTGALNIDRCRIETSEPNPSIARRNGAINHLSGRPARETEAEGRMASRQSPESYRAARPGETLGRWPANLCHDGSDEVLEAFAAFGERATHGGGFGENRGGCFGGGRVTAGNQPKDTGTAARFFYSSKASKADRAGSKHPTVKPVSLMRWLCRLVTPPSVSALVCVSCGHEHREAMPSVRSGVSSKARRTDGLFDPVPQPDCRPRRAEESSESLPDVRDHVPAQGQRGGLLFDELPGCGGNAPEAPVPDLRDESEESAASPLLSEVCGRGAEEIQGAAAESVRALRDSLPAQERLQPEILQPSLPRPSQRLSETQAEHENGARVYSGLRAGQPNGDEGRLCDAASIDSRREDRSAAAQSGGCPSLERDQSGQPAGESRGNAEVGPRPDTQAPAEADCVPPLRRDDQDFGTCPACGGALAWTKRPGLILDPFAGSGTTLQAAAEEGFRAIGIEREAEYVADIERRMAKLRGPLFTEAAA